MADIYFKKDKNKYSVGYSDVIFKYNPNNHNLESLQERFIQCDKNGKVIAKKTVNKKENK